MLFIKGPHVRFRNILITVFLVFIFFYTTRYSQQRQRGAILVDLDEDVDVGDGDVSPEEEYLERLIDTHRLTKKTKWQAWRIQPSERDEEESSMTDVHVNFESQAQRVIDVWEPSRADLHAAKMLALPIRRGARIEETDASDFLFGISTSYERVADRDWAVFRAWQRWLTKGKKRSNGAGLVLMLDRATDEQQYKVDQMLRDAGIDAYITTTDEPLSKAWRYYELVRILKTYSATLAASGQRKRWYGIVEDTVFFPGLSYLRARLAAYDPSEPLYIGLPSERLDWHEDGDGITTSGGGAVLLTREAVAAITELPCLEVDDLEPELPLRPRKWDALLKECLKKHAGLDIHVVPGLYSPGDAAAAAPGALSVASHEAGVRPLVLHDCQDRYRLDVGMAHLVADVCGEACFMQRYVFRDDWVLVNGVSISQYPDGLAPAHGHGYRYSKHDDDGGDDGRQGVEPLAWTGRRSVWRLLDSAAAVDGTVWQAYLNSGGRRRMAPGSDGPDEMDSVIVLIWGNKPR
ncbi:Uncharacterized protein TCAP_02209 [Tolypocladium capitatum]|uniref:Uncharacterized protein n=1 Tax=Tolypocladium capitatum TaxID=45235 RepID=A0A2K3QK12_9HYPO|nr:Uncharacterized protein TCAP_02209 [Tolypocladium capitatum]